MHFISSVFSVFGQIHCFLMSVLAKISFKCSYEIIPLDNTISSHAFFIQDIICYDETEKEEL